MSVGHGTRQLQLAGQDGGGGVEARSDSESQSWRPTGTTIGAVSGIDPSESPKVVALPTTPVHAASLERMIESAKTPEERRDAELSLEVVKRHLEQIGQ
jgi:hypothetical protein